MDKEWLLKQLYSLQHLRYAQVADKILAVHEQEIASLAAVPAPAENKKYRANFLWPPAEGSVEFLFYEFANGLTEEYQKEMYEAILEHFKPVPAMPQDEERLKGFD